MNASKLSLVPRTFGMSRDRQDDMIDSLLTMSRDELERLTENKMEGEPTMSQMRVWLASAIRAGHYEIVRGE